MSEYSKIDDEALREIISRLRVPASPRPDFKDRVMAQVRLTKMDAPLTHTVVRDIPQPGRSYGRVGTYAFVGACLVCAVMVWQYGRSRPEMSDTKTRDYAVGQVGSGSLQTVQNIARERLVRFEIVAPGAKEVSLAGNFNGWQVDATPLKRIDDQGTWAAEVPLVVGRYTYMFVIDRHKWVPDSRTSQEANADFGEANSVITVSAEGAL